MYWITGLVGLALMVAPWLFSYTNDTAALWTSIVLGALIVIVSVVKAVMQGVENWEYWIAGLAGLAAILAPFVLGFNDITAALWTSIVLGVVVAALATYEVFFVRQESAL